MDIKNVVEKAVNNLLDSGKIEAKIEESVENVVLSKIEDQFRSFSDFGRDIEKAIKDMVKVDIDKISLPEYNTMIQKIIEKEMRNFLKVEGAKKFQDYLKEIMIPIDKQEWTLKEFVEEFKKYISRDDIEEADDYLYEEYCQEITCIVDHDSASYVSGYKTVFLDVETEKSKYSCKYRINFNEKGIWNIDAGGTNITKKEVPTILYSFERFLYQFYAQGCNIVDWDESKLDLEVFFEPGEE